MRTTGPLYPSCMLSLVRAAAHRSKQINQMMKSVIKGTTLEDSLNTQPHRLERCNEISTLTANYVRIISVHYVRH